MGVLIYFQASNEATKSALLSTMTNKDGGWSLDLGNLRTVDLQNIFKITPNTKEEIILDAG